MPTCLSRCISHDPCRPAPQTIRRVQRTISLPSRTPITGSLQDAGAVMQEFVRKYMGVWDVDLPAALTIRVSDAVKLLPVLSNLVCNHPVATLSQLHQVSQVLTHMKSDLPYTIDPQCDVTLLSQHGHVFDLLDRAAKHVNDAILLMTTHGWSSSSRDQQGVPALRSPRQILAAAVILEDYFEKLR